MFIILVVQQTVLPSIPSPASYTKHTSGLHSYTLTNTRKQTLPLETIHRNHHYLDEGSLVARRFWYIIAFILLGKGESRY